MGANYGDVLRLDLSGTSPAAASTVAGSSSVSLAQFKVANIYGSIQGATGGNLDVYIQTSYDGGTTWVDLVHFAQKAAGAAAVGYVFTVTRGLPIAATPVTVNTASGTPVLASGNCVPGGLGSYIRRVDVAGASTSAGAAQTIQVELYST